MTDIEILHQSYCEATTFELKLAYDRERSWFEFIKAGFTRDDLKMVIFHLVKGIQKGERREGCLRFRNLIQRLDLFEEELNLARAFQRNFKQPTAKEKALQQLRPGEPMPTNGHPRIAKEVLQGAIDEMRKAVS